MRARAATVSLHPLRERFSIRTPAYLEIGPASGRKRPAVGYVFRFPGLFVDADVPELALEALPSAVAEEHRWLERHGVHSAHAREPVEIVEVERIDLATDVARGVWRGVFQYELRPTSDADVELALERARFARDDLLQAWDALPGSTRATLSARLAAHAGAEWDLLSRLGTRSEIDLPAEPLARLAEVRARAEERLRNLLPGDRERLAVFAGEKWTARKVLRCLAVGERRLLEDVLRAAGLAERDKSRSGDRHSPR